MRGLRECTEFRGLRVALVDVCGFGSWVRKPVRGPAKATLLWSGGHYKGYHNPSQNNKHQSNAATSCIALESLREP